MSRARLGVFAAVCVLAVLWSVPVLSAHVVRLENQTIVQAIRKAKSPVDRRALASAMSHYQWAMELAPCNVALHADLAVLRAHDADVAMTSPDVARSDAALEAMQRLLTTHLACTPRDGKAWLDYAVVNTMREGANARGLKAYRMSALASPSESWLAKKRLEFAITFLPILGKPEITIAREDLSVLERAHPNNMLAVEAAAQVDNKQAVYALFGATPPVEAP